MNTLRNTAKDGCRTNPPPRDSDQVESTKPSVGVFSIIFSVLASFFGVQNEANRKRDFEGGNIWHFIAAGIVLTLVFMLVVWGAVQYMLATSPSG